MFKTLRRRIIIIELAAFFLVTFVIVGFINIETHYQVNKNANEILTVLKENDGKIPKMNEAKESGNLDEDRDFGFGTKFNNETRYTTRYFTVKVSSEGDIVEQDLAHIATVSQETIDKYVRIAFIRKLDRGSTGNYKYLKVHNGDETTIYFVNCYSQLKYVRYMMEISLGIGAVCLILVTIFVYILSGKVIEPMEKNMERQKRFVTDAGHELKTPLAAISVNADVLSLQIGENETLNKIKRQTAKMDTLIQEMLTLAKMEDFDFENEQFTEVNMSNLIKECVGEFDAAIAKKEIRLKENIAEDLILKGQEREFSRLISVLMDNAVKYCTEKGKITVTAKKNRNMVHVVVKNTAEDIKDKDLKHLFDRFYRTDSSRSRDTGGYGIGLSIAKAITDRYKGSICAKKGKGDVSFIFDIPIK